MNFATLPRNVRLYLRAEGLAAQLRLRAMCRRAVLLIVALAFVLFALVLLNMGLFAWLMPQWGPVWTPAGLGLINLGLALLAVLAALLVKPGPELDLAQDMRKSALASLEDDLSTPPSPIPGLQTARAVLPLVAALLGMLRKKK